METATAAPLVAIFAIALYAMVFVPRGIAASSSRQQLLRLCHGLETGEPTSTCLQTARQLCPTSTELLSSHELTIAAGSFSFDPGAQGEASNNVSCSDVVTVSRPAAATMPFTTLSDLTRAASSGSPPAQLQACVNTGVLAAARPHELETWAESEEGDACRALVTNSFAEIRARVQAATERTARNALLRRAAEEWGEPATVAALLLLFGCDASHSYDEFTSCSLDPLDTPDEIPSTVRLDINFYARALRLDGKDWECTTCTIHRHTRWFASVTVAGTVVHTMAQPTCPRAGEDLDMAVPTFAHLDANLSHASFPEKASPIDVTGTRWRLAADRGAVWETTEVVSVPAGHTVLFSPSWYHRVVPPPADATHAAMTMRVEYMGDITFQRGKAVLDDAEIGVTPSAMAVCFTRWDLIHSLLQLPDNLEARRQGLPKFHNCSIAPVRLDSLYDPAVLAKPAFSTPPFLRPLPSNPSVEASSSWIRRRWLPLAGGGLFLMVVLRLRLVG